MANILVIDVGTHKAEEVKVLQGQPHFTPRNRLNLGRKFGLSSTLGRVRKIRKLSSAFRSKHTCRYVLIEPIMHGELLEFVRTVPNVTLLGGVASCNPSGPTTLFMARKSLGNSIIPTKPGLTGKTVETYNFDFAALYEFLIGAYVENGDCDQIVLRINAEGVEGPIIDYLAHSAPRKPNVIAGSIGDIKKCFGVEAYDKAVQTMADAGMPFVYFTANADTWESGLNAIEKVLKQH